MSSLGVVGAAGRMGSRIVAAAAAAGVPVVLRGTREGWSGEPPAAVVDVSAAAALPDVVAYCGKHGTALLSATSGLSAADRATLAELSAEVPVLRADNLSLGNFLQRRITRDLSSVLTGLSGHGLASVGILDRHPAYKVDRPSATALALRDCVRGDEPEPIEVSVDSVRAGIPVCEHDVRIALGDEEVVLRHAVRDWSAYSGVAVRAALWLARRPEPGLWSMDDFYTRLLGRDQEDR